MYKRRTTRTGKLKSARKKQKQNSSINPKNIPKITSNALFYFYATKIIMEKGESIIQSITILLQGSDDVIPHALMPLIRRKIVSSSIARSLIKSYTIKHRLNFRWTTFLFAPSC